MLVRSFYTDYSAEPSLPTLHGSWSTGESRWAEGGGQADARWRVQGRRIRALLSGSVDPPFARHLHNALMILSHRVVRHVRYRSRARGQGIRWHPCPQPDMWRGSAENAHLPKSQDTSRLFSASRASHELVGSHTKSFDGRIPSTNASTPSSDR